MFHSVLRTEFALERNPLGVRDAADLALWFRNKAAALPAGAITARHIDSHDSFWWPLPGFKWRREQYGIEATRAILAIWSLSGGVYMTFIGGETELEDDIRKVHRLRREVPEFGCGEVNFDAVRVNDRGLYAVSRFHEGLVSLLLVNLTRTTIETTIAVDTHALGIESENDYTVTDNWTGDVVATNGSYSWSSEALGSFTQIFAPYQVRVLTIRRG